MEDWPVGVCTLQRTFEEMVLVFSARARMLWGHAPRVRSAAAFRRSLATVADLPTDARYVALTPNPRSSAMD